MWEGNGLGVHIVTDSACSLPAELCREAGITVIALAVQIGRQSLLEGVDISPPEFYQHLRSGERLSTASPGPDAFRDVYAALTRDGDSVISVHVMGSKSAVLSSAQMAANLLPDADISVVDSRSFSLGMGLPVLVAARAARAGADRATVLDLLQRAVDGSMILAAIPELAWLRRSGRVGRAQAMLGSVLAIKPLLGARGGDVVVIEAVRAWSRAVARMLELAAAAVDGQPVHLGIAHTDAPAGAAALAESAAKYYQAHDVVISDAGAVLACHAGPGALAVSVLPVLAGEA